MMNLFQFTRQVLMKCLSLINRRKRGKNKENEKDDARFSRKSLRGNGINSRSKRKSLRGFKRSENSR